MKFIFPQNYSFKSKILGFIDYSTAIVDVFWAIMLFGILRIVPISLKLKTCIFIVFCLPVLLISIIGFDGENIINVSYYLVKYIIKPKVLLYKK